MLNITVGGDAEGGYMVDIHDGARSGTYSPAGVDTDVDALVEALKLHDPELLAKLREATPSPEPSGDVHDGVTASRDDDHSNTDVIDNV